jgi:GWxTD domain-containing protein
MVIFKQKEGAVVRLAASAVVALLIFIHISFAQAQGQAAPFIMNLDYARFQNDDQTAYLELYYSFYCGQLMFSSDSKGYRASIVLATDLVDETTSKAVVREHTVLPINIGDTTVATRMKSVVRQAGHYVPFGNYLLKVVAFDSSLPAMRDSLSIPLNVEKPSVRPAVSDLELCSLIKTSQDTADPFYKNSHEVLPNPTLLFGEQNPVVYVYCELYGLDTAQAYVVEYEMLDQTNAVVKKTVRDRRFRTPRAVEVGTLNAVGLKSGKYSLRLTLKDVASGIAAQSRRDFYVGASVRTSSEAQSPVVPGADAVAGLTDAEVEKEFLQVKYLASPSEMYFFDQLKDANAKKEFLRGFWTRIEAGSESRPPVNRRDYHNRIDLSNQKYSTMQKEGWRTDRGRVFILYGRPDEIERHSSEGMTKPYEIWYYYQIENGVQFVFVDRSGFGDYILVHSTKRDELHDVNWNDYLR